jgi:hypothetical protein
MTAAEIRASLGRVSFDSSCVVPVDDSEVVRHAAPLDDRARAQLREQHIDRLVRDHAAMQAREAAQVARTRARFRVVR